MERVESRREFADHNNSNDNNNDGEDTPFCVCPLLEWRANLSTTSITDISLLLLLLLFLRLDNQLCCVSSYFSTTHHSPCLVLHRPRYFRSMCCGGGLLKDFVVKVEGDL